MGKVKGKIQLSSVSQLKQDATEIRARKAVIEKEAAKLGTILAEAIRMKDQLGESVKFLNGMATGGKESIDAFIKNAKAIGIDASNQPEIKELQKEMADIKEYVDIFNSIGKIPQL